MARIISVSLYAMPKAIAPGANTNSHWVVRAVSSVACGCIRRAMTTIAPSSAALDTSTPATATLPRVRTLASLTARGYAGKNTQSG